MGLFQVIIITIGQYSMGVGSRYAVVFMPLGAIISTFYAIVILFESTTSMKQYRRKKHYHKKKRRKKDMKGYFNEFIDFVKKPKVKPVVSILILFILLFLIGLGFINLFLEDATAKFIVAINCGSIGVLFYATYQEAKMKRRTRR